MKYHIKQKLVLLALALSVSGLAAAQGKPTRLRGDITSFQDGVLTVARASGDSVKIEVPKDFKVNAVDRMQLSDIKKGSYVGIATTTGLNGKLTAREVVVFPEAARGMGEGHYAWDLGAKSTMTNANVDNVVTGTDGRNLSLSYKGGNNKITVPDTVPVVTPVAAEPSDLIPGKKVFVIAVSGSNGTYTPKFLVVEKNGVVPPM